jgi:hypothetical protein
MTTVPEVGSEATWAPGFDGQRAPFQPENEAALAHGARSERHVGPLAARIAGDLLTDPDVPPHIREPMFAASVQAWARAEAVCALMWAWLEERDLIEGLTSATTTTEDEERGKGTAHRRIVTRTVASVIDTLRKYDVHAANLRGRLGLDPASAARVGRDLALSRRMNAGATPLDDALTKIEERRAALPAADSVGPKSGSSEVYGSGDG